MSKSELHTILSSVQMSPVDRKRLVNYLNNFKNNQQQSTDKFIIKYNDDGTVDTNFDDLKAAVLNKNKIIIESTNDIIDCTITNSNENTIELITHPFAIGGFDGNEATTISFGALYIIITKDKTEVVPYLQVFILNGNGDTFLANDGTYHGIGISTVNGLSARLQSIENRIKALEDAANA